MICSRLQTSFLLLPTILLFIRVFHGVSQSSNHQEMVMGREMLERVDDVGANESYMVNSTFILAAKRTYRRDPLRDPFDGLKRYRGGWNISEHHYWAVLRLFHCLLLRLSGLLSSECLCVCFICTCYCCCPKEPYGYSRLAYALSLVFLDILHHYGNVSMHVYYSLLVDLDFDIGCVVLYTGQGKFHGSTVDTFEYVLKQGNFTVDSLRNISGYLDSAQNITVNRVFLPSEMQTKIDNIQIRMNSSANDLATRTDANKDKIQKTLDIVRLILIIVAAVMLFLAFLGFLFSIFGMKFIVSILVVTGWILVAGTLVLCGHPTAHTTLDDILPCVDNATATETLLRTKEATHKLVGVVNQVITNISNINFPPNFAPLFYNQSGPLVPVFCDPVNADLTDRQCSTGEVDLNNATQSYVCEISSTGICMTVGRITLDFYTQMSAAVNVSYGLYTYGPFLANLEDCSFVRETFSKIGMDYCPAL
ncbi:hypothetical protein MKX01_025968 [Papaver californicum]|nr:hypothetical protein MKX01_025968 [Papaver californicum]